MKRQHHEILTEGIKNFDLLKIFSSYLMLELISFFYFSNDILCLLNQDRPLSLTLMSKRVHIFHIKQESDN